LADTKSTAEQRSGFPARTPIGPGTASLLLAAPVNLAVAQEGSSAGDRAASLLSEIPQIVGTIWRAELITLSDHPITMGTIILAFLAVIIGFWISRRISSWLAGVFVQRFKFETGAANAIRTLSFYILFVLFVISALDLVDFPLTAFTIAGGALAIGIGFGSQNVMNNFISGLILNIERPVRVNDLVEVQGTYGIVEHIGARSTRIRAVNNTDIIVPNSFFLENSVINFTLTDDILRGDILVGVVYGSPTREVERLIRLAITEHPRIIKDREPKVWFTEFGDNSLNFEAIFWLHGRSLGEKRQVESDLRFRIDDLFREAKIVIAFPQRDVHLDTVKPLEVRVVGEEKDEVS
jgi:potassium efflux system protein